MTEHDAVQIDVVATEVLSYAMAHNRLPVVHSLALHSTVSRDGVDVTVTVADAQGPLSRTVSQPVDLVAGERVQLHNLVVALDPAAMLQVEEQRPGRIVVEARGGEEVLARHEQPVRVLAARQWLSWGGLLPLELLAAHVMPNDPAVAGVLAEASVLLEERTGSPSLEGYQSGPERVDAIVEAVWDAMRARRIRYAEPPASWADVGQKVRTPTEVLDGRIGTCLDTVVVLAAVLEQAGIRPLLWLVEGHAFLGYWRLEQALDAIAQREVDDVVNSIDLGQIRVVETTLVTARERDVAFADTSRSPYAEFLRGDLGRVIGVTDVWTARRNDVVPLPARRTVDGEVQVVEYRPAVHSAPPTQRSGGEVTPRARAAAQGIPPRVQQWKNTLLDLSLRNRLINYRDSAGVALTVPEGRLGAIEDALHDSLSLQLLPADHLGDVHGARGLRTAADLPPGQLDHELMSKRGIFTNVLRGAYPSRMRNLAYKARTIVEETGANNLYLALGSLVWNVEGKPLRSPLVLVPVRLVSRSRALVYRLELDESGSSTPNYCLLEKLRQLHGLDVPGLEEPDDDGSGIDLDAALDAMRVAVAQKGLPYRVEATADLAILQFAKFRLWKDLDEHWPQLLDNALVRHLVETPTDPFVDPVSQPDAAVDLDELDASCPVPADASQLGAVAEAVAGRTFVLEGPPGTGKSQTITNLLTRAVAEGKRVLFVAEKRAALDVVRSRLDSVGMGAFSLDLHDKASKPVAVRAQIRAALDHAVAVDEQGLSAQQEELRSSRRSLARYAQRLHEPNGAGLSFYSARTSLLALGEDGDLLPVPQTVLIGGDGDAMHRLRHLLTSLPDVADLARPAPDHPWAFAEGLRSTAALDVDAVGAAARAVDEAFEALVASPEVTRHAGFVDAVRSARTADDLSSLAALASAGAVPLAVLDEARSPAWASATSAVRQEVAAFVAAAHPGLDVASPAALDLPLADLHIQAQAAASSSWWGRGKRLKAVLAQLQPALRPGVTVKPKQVPELVRALLQVQGAVRQLAARASSVPGIAVPDSWHPFTDDGRQLVDRQVEWLSWAGATVAASRRDQAAHPFLTALRRFLDSGQPVDLRAAEQLRQAASDMQRLQMLTGASPESLSGWAGALGLVDRWRTTRACRGLGDAAQLPLRRWAALVEHLEPLAAAGMHEARQLLLNGKVSADDAVRAFDRGLALASSVERKTATGLDTFDAESHGRTITRFTRSAAAVRDQMRTAVPAEVLAARPFDPGTGRGQVGALQRELARQRGGLGVRALVAKYGDLITQLMPCVLVSPDSLARFFPVGGRPFDLVVFDEASQIRVADAVGAMGRSQSVVVVGDSKQLPPTTFAEPSSGDDDESSEEALVVQDEESILSECVLARVPQRWLSWHYRSQDESLIAFSNGHYYDGKLSSFPAPRTGGADSGVDGHGISLVPVDGQFHRSGRGKLLRTNPREAEEVVAEIRRRFADSPDRIPSIGVVTFNQQQRAYIEALLRDAGDDRLVEALDNAEEGLFVKNLENVQGDERDVILFSTAFSVNDKGVLPLNFGPLNRGGGERRLNVAVTRARRQVIVFSSFAPHQLRAEETSSIGIKHLRAYLDLAAQGTAALPHVSSASSVPDRHRQQVAAALRERGLLVVEQLGLSDFKVDLAVGPVGAAEPSVAVLLDGPGWAGRRTVGDRDGLPVQVLGRLLKWPAVERVWLPEWLADPAGVVKRLEQAANQPGSDGLDEVPEPRREREALVEARTPSGGGTPFAAFAGLATTPVGERADTAAPAAGTARLPGEEVFRPWRVRIAGGRDMLDALPDRRAAEKVRRVIHEVVEAEGPIHVDRLAKQVAAAFGLTRVSGARADDILDQVPVSLLPEPGADFVWPASRPHGDWGGFRRASEEPRPIEHVSLEEIGNAMVALCSASAGMDRQELLREALAVFGGRRLTPGISARLEDALDSCLDTGRLKAVGGLVMER